MTCLTEHQIIASAFPALEERQIKKGVFRALTWESKEARDAATRLVMKTAPENRDADFWSKRFDAYAQDIAETNNVSVQTGVLGFLNHAIGGSTAVQRFDGTNTFLGVGNGALIAQISTAFTADGVSNQISVRATPNNWAGGNNYNTYGLTVQVGDVLLFTDTTTAPPSVNPVPAAPTNWEYAQVSSVSSIVGGIQTLTFTKPLRYSRALNTYVIISGKSTATGLSASGAGSAAAYKKVATNYPVVGLVGGLPSLTWQVDFTAPEAQFHWMEACIGSVASPPTNAQGTIPSGAVLLAKAAWYPSPMVKVNSLASQQYVFSIG